MMERDGEIKAEPVRCARACCVVSSVIATISLLINIALALIAVFYVTITTSGKPDPPPHHHVPSKSNLTCHLGDQISAFPGLQDPAPRMLVLPSNNSDSTAICWDSVSDIDPRVVSPYELQVDDWWTQSGFYTIYAGPDQSFIHKELVAGITYNYRLLVRRAIGPAKDPDAKPIIVHANITIPNKGGCGNVADVTNFRDNRDTIKKHIQRCMETSLNNDDRAEKCIAGYGLSDSCSACWIAEGHCTLRHCMPACLIPSSDKCITCSKTRDTNRETSAKIDKAPEERIFRRF